MQVLKKSVALNSNQSLLKLNDTVAYSKDVNEVKYLESASYEKTWLKNNFIIDVIQSKFLLKNRTDGVHQVVDMSLENKTIFEIKNQDNVSVNFMKPFGEAVFFKKKSEWHVFDIYEEDKSNPFLKVKEIKQDKWLDMFYVNKNIYIFHRDKLRVWQDH